MTSARWGGRDHHPPCPGGCGQLADECTCRRPNPLGSMTITDPIGSAPQKLTDHTRRALFAEMTAQGIKGADVQRAAMGRILGRVVESRATLTEDEGHTLLDSLRARRRQAEMDAIIEGTDRPS